MATCQIIRDEVTNEIKRVVAPNGSPSNLYRDARELLKNKELALDLWATAYTPSFLLSFGDWVTLERVKRTDPGNQTLIEELEGSVKTTLDDNGEPTISALESYYPQDTVPQDSDSVLRSKITSFLQSIGVNVETAYLPSGVEAQADLLNKIIKVARREVDPTILGEEAAHFFVRMLPRDGALFREMMDKVTSTQVYRDVLSAYRGNPHYQIGGKPNFDLLKQEAIGKLIAQQMRGEPSEAPTSWWSRLLNWITTVFNKKNPFLSAAEDILSSKVEGLGDINATLEDSIMFNLTSSKDQVEAYNQLTDISSRLERKPSSEIDRETKKPIDKYFLDGKEIKRRVTNLAKEFYAKVFPNQNIPDEKREMYNLQAEKGTAIHLDIENIIKRLTDKEGKLKASISPKPTTFNTSEAIYDILETNITERLNTLANKYGVDTRFLTEVKVADMSRDIAGTIDLVVLKPNGRVDIYDWKSMDFNKGTLKDGIPWWKEEAYTIQLDEYAKILKASYGIETDLKRAIPIRAIFTIDPSTKKKTALSAIEIGSSTQVDKEYLNPVPSRTEKTGIREVDKLLDALRSLYESIKDRKASLDERYIKNQELEKIKKAINDIQLKNSLNGFVENGNLLLNNIQQAINNDTLLLSTAQTYYKELLLYADIAKLKAAMGNSNFTEQQSAAIYNLSGKANEMESTLKDWLANAGNEIANNVGVKNVTRIEKNVGFWKGMIRSISNSPNATVNAFYKYLVKFQDDIMEKRNQNNEELDKLKTDLMAWGKAKGLDNKNLFDGMLQFDDKGRWNGGFLNKYTKEFLDDKKKAIEDGNIKKLEELLDLSPEAKIRFEERQKKFYTWADGTQFSLDPLKDKAIRDKKKESWNFQNNVFEDKYKGTALLNYNNGIQGKEKYVTTKWKDLHSKGNEPLLAAYNYFQGLLNYADRNLGMIDNNGKFIPNIENDKLDMWAQYGNAAILNLKGFFESFEYKTNTTYGEIDAITGKPKKGVPKLFLNNLGVESTDQDNATYRDFSLKSKDLFTVFSIWGKHMAEYEYMSKLEEIGTLMLTVEEIKGKHLEKGPDGKYVEVQGNAKNYEYLEDFQNYFVYGQKQKDANAWEFNLFGKNYAGKSIISGAIRYMGMKTLAFNTTSIAANYVGGKFNTFFVATKGKFFDRRQWAFGEYALSQDIGKGLIDYFDVFLEDETYRKARQLSLYESVKKLTYDNLFIGQRYSDKGVQYPVLLAMTQSYGVIDGKIVNLKEYVQQKNNYANIYNLPASDQRALLKKIDAEVKELESKSIYNLSKVGADGKLEIEGVKRGDPTILNFRQQVRRANRTVLGNATSEDISRYRMSLLGQALGQFRNWMPALIDERFGELRYNVDIEGWQKGKARVFFDNYFSATPDVQSKSKQVLEILTKHIGSLVKDFIGFTNDTSIQNRAKILYAKEKARAIEQGLPFDISEHEYIELHLQNLRSMINELRLILAFTTIPFSLASASDDDKNKGIGRYVTRMLDKFNNELLFYYNPINFTQLTQAPIPAISLLEDIFKFFGALAGQGYATAVGDPALEQKYKPTKYILKDIPIMREVYTLGTIFDEDMRRAYEVTR
jgi:hypothetical protein